MRPAQCGPTFFPGVGLLVVAGLTLFLAHATWLQMTMAMFVLLGVALVVRGIATPEFLEGDEE